LKRVDTSDKRGNFDVVATSRLAQVAKMTLQPGEASDSKPSNEHPKSEQWLFVLSGSGEAIIHDHAGKIRRTPLQPESLLLIERGELHQIKNTGRQPLATLNLYAPPAYDADGEVRDEAKGKN
jgi:oxalate decarboxylase/phosphoglucose isomerase-like protein (cupin superfamily)